MHKQCQYVLWNLSIVVLLCTITTLNGHAVMFYPNQRGSLRTSRYAPWGVDETAPVDHYAHFPAGSKSTVPGAARRSQMNEVAPNLWKPYTPLLPGFRWRSGVCGDLRAPVQDHRRGGKFYHNAKIAKAYRQGSIIEIGMTVVTHHNGFIELYVCNVQHCYGEISEWCFRHGFCKQLQRHWDRDCETRFNKKCGPIDPNYPGRWYLPCTTAARNSYEYFGPTAIKYRLPPGLNCKHCVLQWFYSSANSCNPPGVVEYFDGPRGPLWGNCRGQAGAIGGVTRVQQQCGTSRDKFPEEFIQCADIQIVKSP